jgi:hypothetical protein
MWLIAEGSLLRRPKQKQKLLCTAQLPVPFLNRHNSYATQHALRVLGVRTALDCHASAKA